jgi:ABC-type uncharacterized transport system permease subunit
MSLPLESALGIGGTALYCVSAVLALVALLRSGERKDNAPVILLAGGMLLLMTLLSVRLCCTDNMPVFSRFDALASYALALSAAYLLLAAFRPTRGIAAILIPYAAVSLLCGVSALRMGTGAPLPVQGFWLVSHVITAYAAFGVFTLASLNAVLYLVQDSNLKHKRLGLVWERLPSLETLDHLMSRLAGVAFLLLTISVVLGFVLVRRSGGGDDWFTDPKVLATIVTWIVLAVFVHMRASADRHGRGIALMALVGLACLLFAFVGVPLVAHTLHSFLQMHAGVPRP